MNRSAVTRKLAAILITDVVGFSRHMERDDAGAFERLREIRVRIIDPKAAEHGGRVVKTAGDGMLLEFGSADAALRFAIEVQRAMAVDNQSKRSEERIEFRIGINLGDIIVDGNDIAGDGVNVAARLEALAPSGGICVSAAVREQVHGSLDVSFDDIGEQHVKNIMRTIRAFIVALNSTTVPRSAIDQTGRRPAQTGAATLVLSPRALLRQRGVWAALFLCLVAAGLLVLGWNWRPHVPEPPVMSVGVLPLVAPAGDVATTQRLEPLTRDLLAQLTRADVAIRALPVTARQSSPVNLRDTGELARMIQVRYVLDGEVQPRQDVTEIRLRLVNGASGAQVWNETVSLKEPASATDQMRTLRRTMEHLRSRLFELEIRRSLSEPGGATTPMDHVLRAHALDKADKSLHRFRQQEAIYEEALRRDPDLVPALLGVFSALDGQLDVDSRIDRERLIRRMDVVTSRAVNPPGSWWTIATLRAKRYSTNPEYLRLAEAHWYAGLRMAGIAEQ